MYKYEKNIISFNTDQVAIFEEILNIKVILNQFYTSPFRKDSSPGCFFNWYNDILYFVDYGDIKTHKNCFDIVEQLNITLVKDYKLQNENITVVDKKKVLIDPFFRDFSNKDKIFWGRFYISRDNLTEDLVNPVNFIRITNLIDNSFYYKYYYDITYCYNFNPHYKIYNPKGDKKNKWISTCTKEDIGGINNLKFNFNYLIITKSYKDYRVLKNFGYDVIWFQNEGCKPNIFTLELLFKKYEQFIFFYDNDFKGLNSVEILCNYYSKYIICSYIYLYEETTKDISDHIEKYGPLITGKEIEILIRKVR